MITSKDSRVKRNNKQSIGRRNEPSMKPPVAVSVMVAIGRMRVESTQLLKTESRELKESATFLCDQDTELKTEE